MTVYLVGAGPGDPGLLTRRGAELLARADVVVHDRLSAAELLDLAPTDAERIDVGKAPDHHRMAQADINALLVERGRQGQQVVRLKGGDPFVFARGSEEARALAEAGVPYEVVPGITSALAVPASAGIPVTQRFSSTSFTVVTGHEDPASGEGSVDWDALARVGGTLVILMGVGRWPAIAHRLLAAGLAPDTPAAAVRWGTRPEQHTTRATLATLGDHPLESPSVIVVGDVAAEHLDWFESRPLAGRRVVVTRARAQASGLAGRLRELGADVIEAPTIAIAPPADGGAALADAVARIAEVDWLVLTSPNGVAATFDHIPDVRALAGVRVAVVGTGTREALAERRVVADLVPERFVAEGLLAAFPAPPPPPQVGRVLLAQATGARPVLAEGLAAAGWTVEVVEAYRTVAVVPDDETLHRVSTADAATFTSSSTVDHLVAAIGDRPLPPVLASIGPITSATLRGHGLDVAVEAAVHSPDGLVDALVAHLAPRPHGAERAPCQTRPMPDSPPDPVPPAANDRLVLADEVADALAAGRPVVALESTIISHGLPRPRNLEVAAEIEATVRAEGAVPATIAVVDGVARIGLEPHHLRTIATSDDVAKVSLRDLAVVVARGGHGATTVASTAHLAARAGIAVFATGGLGGVHREARTTWDESADLDALARTGITVVSAGVKSILDVAATLERLETLNVAVVGYRTRRFPGFYLTDSGHELDWQVDAPEDVAAIMAARRAMGTDDRALLVANPLAADRQVDPDLHDRVLRDGLAAAEAAGVRGKAVTPFLLAHVHEASGGESLRANVEIILGNAALAARIAVAAATSR